MIKNVLAFDFGASSGRAMLGTLENEKLVLTEVHRFDNDPVLVNGNFYWDVLRLFHEIKQGMLKAKQAGGFDTIGIDTWGVDFGLIGKDGNLLENPYNYRDSRTAGMPEAVEKVLSRKELYQISGNQIMNFNTIFQLYSLKLNRPELLDRAETLLLMPDLFHYFLTGEKEAERSIASTTQLLDPYTKEWNAPLLERLGLEKGLLPKLVSSGTTVGQLKKELCEELDLAPAKVVATACHDTASAVAAVPTQEKDFVFISCGTWSLFGTELDSPVINDISQKYNITNEVGVNDTTRFLKNIIGLWLIQETRRQFAREGKKYSYAQMEAMARECRPFACFIDPDEPAFAPPGNVPQRIRDFCEKTGQCVPQTDGEIIRCIYESLAMKYKYTFEQLKQCCNKNFQVIHMVGGGTKDSFLCQMTADAAGVPVIAGPIEATASGNIMIQLMASGAIKDIREGREIIARSFEPVKYAVQEHDSWQKVYPRFCEIIAE